MIRFAMLPEKVAMARVRMTNADCIRHMSDEELASWIAHIDSGYRRPYARKDEREWLDWLRQEVQK